MKQSENVQRSVMVRAARGMLAPGIASDVGISVGEVLGVLWDYGGDPDDYRPSETDDPSPSQIRARALAIRSEWTAEDLRTRRGPSLTPVA